MGKWLTAGILSVMLLLGTGCTESPKKNTSMQESQGSSQSSTKLPQEETSKPYPFTFQPHVLSEEYKQAYGKKFEKSFYEFAMLCWQGKRVLCVRIRRPITGSWKPRQPVCQLQIII